MLVCNTHTHTHICKSWIVLSHRIMSLWQRSSMAPGHHCPRKCRISLGPPQRYPWWRKLSTMLTCCTPYPQTCPSKWSWMVTTWKKQCIWFFTWCLVRFVEETKTEGLVDMTKAYNNIINSIKAAKTAADKADEDASKTLEVKVICWFLSLTPPVFLTSCVLLEHW